MKKVLLSVLALVCVCGHAYATPEQDENVLKYETLARDEALVDSCLAFMRENPTEGKKINQNIYFITDEYVTSESDRIKASQKKFYNMQPADSESFRIAVYEEYNQSEQAHMFSTMHERDPENMVEICNGKLEGFKAIIESNTGKKFDEFAPYVEMEPEEPLPPLPEKDVM